MTFEIAFVLCLLPVVILCLIKEWVAPEIAAMSGFALLIAVGILDVDKAVSVFSNAAPITIGALFIITFALEKTGGLDSLAAVFRKHLPESLHGILLGTSSVVALASAFINNTPIVALFMPVLLGLARARKMAPSKLLIPLSYSSIMGGCCTLIGTSTNIIVSGIMVDYGSPALGMFELARLGVPICIIGLIYIAFISPHLIADRSNVTATLSEEERRTFFCQLLVNPGSPWIGQRMLDVAIARSPTEYRLIEVRRKGANLNLPLDQIRVEAYDRVLISAGAGSLEASDDLAANAEASVSEPGPHLKTSLTKEWGVEALSTLQGGVMEGVISQHSQLIGKTIEQARFRQQYGMLVLAVHRQGRNLKKHFANIRLQFGDTLLLLGPQWRFEELRTRGDLMLLDEAQAPPAKAEASAALAWATIGGVVLLATLNILPIVAAALMGAVFLLLIRVLTPDEAFKAIDWPILFLIFGMLGVGLAMESTGAARWIAQSAVASAAEWVPEAWLPYVALALVLGLTSVLTEILSNNAVAAVMAPVAYNLALSMGLEPRPFFIAVMFAASLSFSTPIGYQTNTMVFNAGGYRFGDFLKVGTPLNFMYWIFSSIMIPFIWPFAKLG